MAPRTATPTATLAPQSPLRRLLGRIVVAVWARLQPAARPPRRASPALSDNVQQTMNLIMPLRDPTPAGRAVLLQLFMAQADVVLSGLHNVGTVHYARFDFLDDKLCLFSIYDGDFAAYIRDFIVSVGAFFNGLMPFIEDPPPLPVERHVDEFVDWVAARDPGPRAERGRLRDLPRRRRQGAPGAHPGTGGGQAVRPLAQRRSHHAGTAGTPARSGPG